MCRPVDGSREAVCPGGHIGPPLHNAGNVPEITESGVENEHFPNGAGRSPPPTEGAEQGGLRRGAPRVWLPPAKFRNGIWGVSHGHPALRVRHRWCTARADVGIGPYGEKGRFPQPPRPAAHSGASALRSRGNGWELRQRSSPKGPATPDNPSVMAFGHASSLYTREPWGAGDADCRVASLLAMTVRILCHSEEAQRADVGIRPFTMDGGSGRRT